MKACKFIYLTQFIGLARVLIPTLGPVWDLVHVVVEYMGLLACAVIKISTLLMVRDDKEKENNNDNNDNNIACRVAGL